MDKLIRYSLITKKMPREFLLLQGTGCIWKKCKFCDYYLDLSPDPYKINKEVLNKVTGRFGILDIINSGSCLELDNKTIELVNQKVKEFKIHKLWFESHWIYKNKLPNFAKKFRDCQVNFRVGIETFDPKLRSEWNKGIPCSVTAEEISKHFSGCCLLIGVQGQTKNIILNDIEIALKYFDYFSINVFVENSTNIKRDNNLIRWFKHTVCPKINDNPKIEILLNNTDLGVG